MSARPNPPFLTLSSTACRWMGLAGVDRVAQMAGVKGVDLELKPSLVRELLREDAGQKLDTPVASIWIAGELRSSGQIWRRTFSAEEIAQAILACGPTRLVLDRPQATSDFSSELIRAVRERGRGLARVTIAIRSDQLEGTRDHLSALAALRRTAEEWDYDLALDLSGPIDPRWEAEAALSRVLPRVTVIRVGSLTSRPPNNARARLTHRALAFALDQGYQDNISVAPYVPLWRAFWLTPIASAFIEDAQAIRAKYELIHHVSLPPAGDRPTRPAKHHTG